MYFWTLFSVPSLKQLLAKFLHFRGAARPCCCTLDIFAEAALVASGSEVLSGFLPQ